MSLRHILGVDHVVGRINRRRALALPKATDSFLGGHAAEDAVGQTGLRPTALAAAPS